MASLFSKNYENVKPLATSLRPEKLEDFVGQEHILGKNGILTKLIKGQNINNSIFYGPSGCGKTTLGLIISKMIDCDYRVLNCTIASLDDLREVVNIARQNIELYNRRTILFLDEIHRFNKKQQDALLGHLEDGTLILIGATTENPYYSLNNALLSRVMLFEFYALTDIDIAKIISNASVKLGITIPQKIIDTIVMISQGDSRIALNYVELYNTSGKSLSENEVIEIFSKRERLYHKSADKYTLISALIKSMRGSDPDASLYWLARLLDGGEDPRFIARRIMILAAEDIGLANPDALNIAHSTLKATEVIGMPEVRIILSEAVIYMAISSKSNSAYMAINSAMSDVKVENIEVPKHLENNNPTYKYPHSYENNFVRQVYLPSNKKYYIPGNNRYERLIDEKLTKLWGKKLK